MSDQTHIEQQAILRALSVFTAGPYKAFASRGIKDIGVAFNAYLLMQLVSAKVAELPKDTVPTLVTTLAIPLTAKEEGSRAKLLEATMEAAPVG